MLLVSRSRHPRRGFIAVKLALLLTVIVGIVAINLDGGRMMDERRHAQAAADAAALAAAANLYEAYWTDRGTDTSGAAHAAALESASANGYPAAAVTVNIPPLSGTFAGQAGYAEVIINTALDATFGQFFTGTGLPVSARGVARGQPLAIGVITLANSGAGSFTNSSLAFALVNKPLIVDSSDPAAFDQASFGAFVAGRVDVTGGAVNPGGAIILAQINTGVTPTIDPLAYLPIPTSSSVQSTGRMTINSLLPVILQPGVYQGGIHVTNASIVVMEPGVYIMQGGGFVVDSLATVTGIGVMVYNTTSGTYASGPIAVGGVGKMVMIAPLSGTYQGINFFQDRSLTQPISVTGLGLTTITGVVYAAQAPVNLTGSAAVGLDILGGAYVVNSLNIGGVGAVTINLGLNPPRVPDVRVVE
jgi:Flp pilus assembly protein TadG